MRRTLLAAMLGCFLLIGVAAAQTVPAVKANDFLNSLGMNTDVVKGSSNEQQVEYGIQFTGVRNFREEATHNVTGPESYQAECDIHSVTGAMVSTIAIVDSEFYGEPPGSAITDEKKALDTLATCGALGLVESHNEPANEPMIYLGNHCSLTTSFLPCAQYERDMYAMVNSDPQLKGRPISGMSEPGAEPDDSGLQYLTVPSNDPNVEMPAGTKLADMADSHGYVEGNGQNTPIDNQSRLASDIYAGKFNSTPYAGTWDVYAEYWGATWGHGYPAAPCTSDAQCQSVVSKVQTEDGWNVFRTGHDNTFCPTVGNLLVDKYLDNYQLGYLNTFVYHMIDSSGDSGWCVYNANPTSATDTTNALPVALYLHNLTQILADTSSAFTPVNVANPVVGMPSTGYFMPIQKSNGTMEYVLWGEAFQSGTATQVTVNLPGNESVVNVYDVTSAVNPSGPPVPTVYHNVAQVTVSLKDHPMVVEFAGSSSTLPFVGRSQGSTNTPNATTAIATPAPATTGDMMTLVVVSNGVVPTGPPGWAPLGTCTDGQNDFVGAWTRIKQSAGVSTYYVKGNWPKAIMRVYRGPTVVDSSACSPNSTIPALAATAVNNESYVATFFSASGPVTPPGDLGNVTTDTVQWGSADGDKGIPMQCTVPPAETATAGSRTVSYGITLK